MSTPSYPVWGFDGHFQGNEDRIHLALPVLEAGGQLWAVRRGRWEMETGEGLKRLGWEEAEVVVTRLDLRDGVCLSAGVGDWLLIIGPRYKEALEKLELGFHIRDGVASREVDNGFMVAVQTPSAFELLNQAILKDADALYLEELRGSSRRPTDRATAAHHLLQHTPLLDSRRFFVRDILHARWEGNAAREQRILEIAPLLGEVTEVELKTAADAEWHLRGRGVVVSGVTAGQFADPRRPEIQDFARGFGEAQQSHRVRPARREVGRGTADAASSLPREMLTQHLGVFGDPREGRMAS